MKLLDMERMRLAMAELSAAAERVEKDEPALARVLADVGTLVDRVGSSLAQQDLGAAAGQAGLGEIGQSIRAELGNGAGALDALRRAFFGRLRDGAAPVAAAYPYARLPEAVAAPAAVATLPEQPDAIFVCAIGAERKPDRFIDVNAAACRMLGYARAELLGMSFADVYGLDQDIDARRIVDDVLAGVDAVVVTTQRSRVGNVATVELHAHRLAVAGPPAMLVVVHNPLEREYAEEQLRLWQKAFEASVDAIVITDSDERILAVNRAVTDITGYTAEEVIGQTPRVFHSGRHDSDFYRKMWASILSTGRWLGEIWDRRKNGEIYPKWLSISAVPDPAGRVTHYIASFSDITLRKNYEEEIQHLANHDVLTGLPNRRRLQESLELEIAHARRSGCKLYLLFLDLDHFKEINDTLGHALGDKFLLAVAATLKSCLRATDIISRLGGDEFVIVLSDGHGAIDLPHILDKLAASLATPLDIDGHQVKASVSVGIGIFPDDGGDFETLLHKADTAMYQAKRKGGGGFLYFDRDMNVATKERELMLSQLRDALGRGEIRLHYQPRVSLRQQCVVGVEAALSWQSPLHGQIDAKRFVPLAEDCGAIDAIAAWVLQQLCREAARWQAAGWRDFSVALKLLPAQYRRQEMTGILAQALAAHDVAPACIQLGFAEASLIKDRDGLVETAGMLKRLGVGLFLDGFGSGYSNLSFLKRCAVDQVKVDALLVAGLPDDRSQADILHAAIQAAKCLGLSVVADGVSSAAQADFLRAVACDMAQGPLYGQEQMNPLARFGSGEYPVSLPAESGLRPRQ